MAEIMELARANLTNGLLGKMGREHVEKAKQELDGLLHQIEKEADGVFKLSLDLRLEVDALKIDISGVEGKNTESLVYRLLVSEPPISSETEKCLKDLEKRIRNVASKVWFWSFIRP